MFLASGVAAVRTRAFERKRVFAKGAPSVKTAGREGVASQVSRRSGAARSGLIERGGGPEGEEGRTGRGLSAQGTVFLKEESRDGLLQPTAKKYLMKIHQEMCGETRSEKVPRISRNVLVF